MSKIDLKIKQMDDKNNLEHVIYMKMRVSMNDLNRGMYKGLCYHLLTLRHTVNNYIEPSLNPILRNMATTLALRGMILFKGLKDTV